MIQLLVALLAAEAVVAGAAAVQVAALAVVALELLVVLAAHVVVAPARLVGDGRAGRRHRRRWLSSPAPRLRAAGLVWPGCVSAAASLPRLCRSLLTMCPVSPMVPRTTILKLGSHPGSALKASECSLWNTED